MKTLPCVLACLAGLACAQMAFAQPPPGERLSSLSAPGLEWGAGHELELSGIPVYARPFTSTKSAVHVARSLASHTDIFQRALSLPGKLVLSGLSPDWHWLAQIESTPAGAMGRVSALSTSTRASSRSGSAGFTWLPSHAARQFSHRVRSAAGTVEQQVYSVPLAPDQLTAYLRRQLRAEGWVAEPVLAATGHHSAWHRNGARLMLFPRPSSSGSSLYIHHAE